MRYVSLFLLLLSGLAQAQDAGDLRLIQAQASLPNISLWLNLPTASVVQPGQFSVNVGAESATVQRIESFRQTGEGVAYIFLVDISKSLNARQFQQIKQALQHWLDGMGAQDQAALISFGREVKQIQTFTADRARLNHAIDTLTASDMETSLYGGLLGAISLGRSQQQGLPLRRAIVVLSDGIDDTVAGVSLDELFKQSQEYRVPVYSIGFAAPPINDSKRQGLKVLGMLARQSGGFFLQAEADQLDGAYQQQHEQIMQAYRLQIHCPSCRADGQLNRLNLTWNDGQRTLSDGLDIRLLPNQVSPQVAATQKGLNGLPIPTLIFAIGFLAFLLGLALVYRQRLAQTKPDAFESDIETLPSPSTPTTQKTSGVNIRLTVVTGMQKGKIHRLLITDQATLGRAGGCDLILDDDVEISGRHAMLQVANGKLSVRDLNSTNGILVNGVPIHNLYPLRHGDLLLLGRTELRVEMPGQTE